ncbi:hypothetical protein JG688_00015226 [Phytophthora aleatoria]|uniref:Uncharacterized protein n=1 Tax=Phytophthora aleatoria TaxID=2496075 RepID=A0A8J5ITM5_9STRA|nr:hypothetical protein JG688_00015226 [Phytophthora aleatoria]
MEPGKVNLLAKYGRRTINIRDLILTVPESTAFLRDYAFNEKSRLYRKAQRVTEKYGSVLQMFAYGKSPYRRRVNRSGRTQKMPSVLPMHGLYPTSLLHSPSCDSVGKSSLAWFQEITRSRIKQRS